MNTQAPSSNPLPVVAAFDFDRTLTTKDAMLPYLQYVCGTSKLVGPLIALIPSLIGFSLGITTRQQVKEHFLTGCIGGRELLELQEYGRAFVKGPLQEMLVPEGMQRVNGTKNKDI